MTLVPINSTLNRVMIKELSISATLVAVMASLPYLVSPIQVAIGSYADRHPIYGYYRTPYILTGLIFCVAGVMMSPQIAFALASDFWLGIGVGILAFGAWGLGYNLAAVSYLSLASELSEGKGKGRTIAVMWVMMILGIILTAITLGRLVDPYTEVALQRAFLIIGAIALFLGLLGLVGLEGRGSKLAVGSQERASWSAMAQGIWRNSQARVFFWYLVILLAAILGQDILLEPFAAEAFHMSVKETTQITSFWGIFVMLALILTGWLETRYPKHQVAAWGGWGAFLGFGLITLSGVIESQVWFFAGVLFLGVGTGVSTVSNLSLMLDMTISGQVGQFVGAWGMANAISRLVGSVLGGAGRDILTRLTQDAVLGYVLVFGTMAVFMLISLGLLKKIDVRKFQQHSDSPSVIERAAIAGDV
jgi:BCD family chlorophyll transporter-like MFS transporter